MKSNVVWMRSLVVTFGLVVLSACCRYTHCDCIPPTVAVQYESDSLSCEGFGSLITLRAYNTADGEEITEPIGFENLQCIVEIPYARNRFWVISSDSLNFSDTIAVKNISLYTSSNDCCDCGNQISSIELSVNGESLLNQNAVIKF